MNVIIHPCSEFGGTVRAPGDKSISHRVLILAALASGGSSISGILRSEDCDNTIGALESLGARASFEREILKVTGTGGKWRRPRRALDLGNSGTGMRLLAGVLAGVPMTTELTGDSSLRSRPMLRIKEPLELMGAKVELLGGNGCPPIRITGGRLAGIEYEMPIASAQVKSCILLASLFCRGRTRVREPMPTRDHTERLLKAAGVPVSSRGECIELEGFGERGPGLQGGRWRVPGDFSSAAFWLAAGALMEGPGVGVEGVGLNPRRTGFMETLKRMGADISVVPDECSECSEPCGRISVKRSELSGVEVHENEIAGLIDELPLVAAAGAVARGKTVIRGARELRVKESDRIACTAVNLRLLGVPVEERDDGLIVKGGSAIRGNVRVDSFGDHRMAMVMAVLAMRARGPVVIERAECVNTSYPEFWRHMRSMGAHVEFDYCD